MFVNHADTKTLLSVQIRETVRDLETKFSSQHEHQQEISLRGQHMKNEMESLQGNLKGLQFTIATLKEQLDQLEANKACLEEKVESVHELKQTARKYERIESYCSSLEEEVAQKDTPAVEMETQFSKLQNQLIAANLKTEEMERVMESVKNEKAILEAVVGAWRCL